MATALGAICSNTRIASMELRTTPQKTSAATVGILCRREILSLLVVVDVQKGFLGKFTNYIPEAVSRYIDKSGSTYSAIVSKVSSRGH